MPAVMSRTSAVVALVGACLVDCAALHRADEVRTLATTTGGPLEGWFIGPKNTSCTGTCAGAGLSCSEAAMAAHNKDIDSNADMDKVLEALNTTACYWHEHAFSHNGDTPAFAPHLASTWFGDTGKTWCTISDPARTADTYDCDAVSGEDSERLCYCSPPSPPSASWAAKVTKALDKKASAVKKAKKAKKLSFTHKLAVDGQAAATGQGWAIGDAGQSCTAACTSRGLTCSEADEEDHNNEVDTDTEFDALLSQLGEGSCFWHSHTYGINGNVASFAPHVGTDFFGANKTWCAVSEPGRPTSSYSCSEHAPPNAKRLCYCS